MTIPASTREIRLASRPDGAPKPENFEIADVPMPTPTRGELLVRNLVLSVDPYMRGRMRAAKSYVQPYRVGEVMWGGAVGEVVMSTVDSHAVGDIVLHGHGWREYAIVDAAAAERLDPEAAPLGAYLGVLGMPGLTAYAGVIDVAQLKEDDVVFVSGAAGATGSVAGQIARLRGASQVIGSAGSAEKVEYLIDELGFDEAFNYKDGPVGEQLAKAAPDGIDVYFDNVGGDHLEAAIDSMNLYGRIAMCGAISRYNVEDPPPGPRNLGKCVGWRLRIEGFLVSDYAHLRDEFLAEATAWIRDDELRYQQTIVKGFENTPQAFMDMLAGVNTGKMLVEL
jgi:NADPH-dependent curcumin reductase CurA